MGNFQLLIQIDSKERKKEIKRSRKKNCIMEFFLFNGKLAQYYDAELGSKKKSKSLWLPYVLMFSFIFQTDVCFLKKFCSEIIRQIEEDIIGLSKKKEDNSSSEIKKFRLCHSLIPFLLIFLSHGSDLLISDKTIFVDCCCRLLRLVLETDTVEDIFFFVLQSVLYIVLHQSHLFPLVGASSANSESSQTVLFEQHEKHEKISLIQLPILQSLLLQCLHRCSSLFTWCQWKYLEIFLLPLLRSDVDDSKETSTSPFTKEEVLKEIIQNITFQDHIQQEMMFLKAKSQVPINLIFQVHPSVYVLRQFFQSTELNYIKNRQLFHMWPSSTSPSSNEEKYVSNFSGVPDIHSFTYSHFLSFLLYCKSFLIPTFNAGRNYLHFQQQKFTPVNNPDGTSFFNLISEENLLLIFSFLPYKKIVKLTIVEKSLKHLIFQRNIFWGNIYFKTFPRQFFLDDYIRKHSENMSRNILVQCAQESLNKLKKEEIFQCQQCLSMSKSSSRKACKVKNSDHSWFLLLKVSSIFILSEFLLYFHCVSLRSGRRIEYKLQRKLIESIRNHFRCVQ